MIDSYNSAILFGELEFVLTIVSQFVLCNIMTEVLMVWQL